MTDKRRGLGRGLGALIPNGQTVPGAPRPSDVFFAEWPSTHPANEVAGEGFTGNSAASTTAPVETPSSPNAKGSAAGGEVQQDAGPELRPVPGASFAEIAVAAIRTNPRQPRQVFDEDDLAELVHSVREIGVLQPIVVRPIEAEGVEESADGIRYELIMGERRWRASRAAGNETVPAIVRRTADEDLLRDALLENLHRAQLNPLEEAAAYQQLLEDFGCTHEELASRIGRSRPQISNTLRLMKLPPLVQRRVAAGVLSAGHARALLGLPDGASMERLAQRIVAEGLSVRSVEEIVTLGLAEEKPARSTERAGRAPAPELEELASRLSDRFDTRVGVSLGRSKGKITVEFASVEDLDRIVNLLGLEP